VAESITRPAGVRNYLLAALPPSVLAQLMPKLHSVPLESHAIIQAPEAQIEAVYFPEGGWVSMVADLVDGARAEIGLAGREGMVGVPLVLGIDTASNEAMVQGPGTALRMEAGAFRQALDEAPALRALLLRYTEAMHIQVSQTAACNGHHGLEQRLARWLLLAHDRTAGDELPLTQEFLALMLCVHRPSITVAARILQRANLIRYSAGNITVLDRSGLEAASCECYRAIKRQYRRLLG
jgi:CRP-like cAMP-binding protein